MDDDALLRRLAELLPPPPEPLAPAWDDVEEELGTALPSDFKAFGDRWGFGGVQETAFTIDPPSELGWMLDHLEDLMEQELLERRPVFPGPGGLLPWGSTESTKWYLCWTASGAPEDWTVTLEVGGAIRETGLRFLAYLVGALDGSLAPDLVPEEVDVEPDAPPAGRRGHRWYAAVDAPQDEDPDDLVADAVFVELATGERVQTLELALGRTLGLPPGEALDAFLASLEPALRARVGGHRARAAGERLQLDDLRAAIAVAEAAVRFVARRTGRPIADPQMISGLFDDDER